MRILKGQDFYDGAGWGQDDAITFVRDKNTLNDTPFFSNGFTGRGDTVGKTTTVENRLGMNGWRRTHEVVFTPTFLIFCGTLIPIVFQSHGRMNRLADLGDDGWKTLMGGWNEVKVHYTLEETLEALDKVEKPSQWLKAYIQGEFISLEDALAAHFQTEMNKDQKEWIFENRIVLGVLDQEPQRELYPKKRSSTKPALPAIVNGDFLGDLEFYRFKDPATTHQDIAQFVGGVLPHQKDIVDIGNASKIRKAGFDDRSFRQDKGVKKPRRRKSQNA